MTITIVAATSFEIAPFVSFLKKNAKQKSKNVFQLEHLRLIIMYSGIGTLATGASLMQQLLTQACDCCLQVGIGGAYPHTKVSLGDLAHIISDRLGDLGVYDAKGNFQQLSTINLEEATAGIFPSNTPDIFSPYLEPIHKAHGLTVNAPLGDPQWQNQFEFEKTAIVIESMEGAAFHYVCQTLNIPFLQIRAISNWVEPRDKNNWKMAESIANLNNWLIATINSLSKKVV